MIKIFSSPTAAIFFFILLTVSLIIYATSLYHNGVNNTGDAINGILTPFLTLFGGLLIYHSFKEQQEANSIQRQALAEEKNRVDKANRLIYIPILKVKKVEFLKIPNKRIARVTLQSYGANCFITGKYRFKFAHNKVKNIVQIYSGERIIVNNESFEVEIEFLPEYLGTEFKFEIFIYSYDNNLYSSEFEVIDDRNFFDKIPILNNPYSLNLLTDNY